jgi:phage internal scaffolding protein
MSIQIRNALGKNPTREEVDNYYAEMKKPKYDKDGNRIRLTQQSGADETNINNILKKFDKTGLITHVSKIEATYGEMTGLDLKTAQDTVTGAQTMFNALPVEIRNRFKNDPVELLTFMENPDNREEAIELGLIKKSWSEATDGLGEYVPEGGNLDKNEDKDNDGIKDSD